MPENNKGTPLPEDQDPNPGNQDANIPGWMKEAGWEKDSGSFDESKPIFDNLDDGDEIVPADIPAWLEDAAPEGFSVDPNATPAFEGLNEEESFITTGDLVPRTPQEEVPAPVEPTPTEDPKPASSEPELDIPSWLKNLEMDEDSQETAVAWLENMPESLRATEEELAASMPSKPETLDPPVDEMAWMDEIAIQEEISQAELSEDLVASELIPEQGDAGQIFAQEEIQSMESDAPDWLQELGDSDAQPPVQEIAESEDEEPVTTDSQSPEPPVSQQDDDVVSLMPDWLSDLAADEPAPESESIPEPSSDQDPADSGDLPGWLGDFESGASDKEQEEPSKEQEEPSSLDWLDNLAGESSATIAEEDFAAPLPEPTEHRPEEPILEQQSSFEGDVSPNDETLNTQVPDWLANIGDTEVEEEEKLTPVKSDADESASWLDKIDKPLEGEPDADISTADGEVIDWLENMDDKPEEPTSIDDLRESLTGEIEEDQKPVELETAKYLTQEEDSSENMPDWLGEIAGEVPEKQTSLESAIRESDHSLSDEEKEFLSQAEETHDENADWLAKLDLTDVEAAPEPEIPAIKVDLPENSTPLETLQTEESEDLDISGGILDRLRDPAESQEPEVPQWLENLKKEEDPQETAILWLKQFVERGNEANLQDEIKRYTDELNPGDTVPKWMEDLKHEEDPQTTAMLWLEKLAGERPEPETPKPPKEEVEAGWMAELEKEEAEQTVETIEQPEKDFHDTNDGWLADLEIDQKVKSEEPELPDLTSDETKEKQEGDTPLWMKATSPLEGDFHTDELAGSEEKEVEIPAWLAGYGEGEGPEDGSAPTSPEPSAPDAIPDEYAWVAESESKDPPKPSKDPIDLNIAAISQLESILGISYQIAQGIVKYREKQGPFRELKDLLLVPEITDEQTIEILKPEVFIQPFEEKTKPKPTPKPAAQDTSIDERLQLAKALMAESQIPESLEHYGFLIKKKKSVTQVIDDLVQAAVDHPVDISILKTLGDAYMRIDKLDEALEAYSKAEDLLR